jgi:hypothetical protein
MTSQGSYPQKLRERAAQMVFEHQDEPVTSRRRTSGRLLVEGGLNEGRTTQRSQSPVNPWAD